MWVLACYSQTGGTAIIYAAENGHIDCVRLLVEAGADKDAEDYVCGNFYSQWL